MAGDIVAGTRDSTSFHVSVNHPKHVSASSLQAWIGGLEHFLSNAPSDSSVADVAEILTSTSNGGEIVVRTMNSTAIPKHGPGLGMYPGFLTFDRDHFHGAVTYL